MLTAREACAVSHLLTPKDFSLHKHIEIRIWDSIQNGGKSILYAGEITDNVIYALRALGFRVTPLKRENSNNMLYRIGWAAVPSPELTEEEQNA